MDLNLKDKVVLVCGASPGLGFATAQEFARENATTVICSRNEDRIKKAAQKIYEETNNRVDSIKIDLKNKSEVEKSADFALSECSKVDILVNNTGGPSAGMFMDFTAEDWLSAFNNTFTSAVNLTKRLIPEMISQKWGRIINLISISVKQPVPNLI